MNFFRPIRPLLQGWLLSFTGFGFLACLLSLQFLAGHEGHLDLAIRSSLRDFLPWAVLTPLLFRLAARYPVSLKRWRSRFSLHLVVCLAMLGLCHWWTWMVDPGFRAGQREPPPRRPRPDDDWRGRPPPPPPPEALGFENPRRGWPPPPPPPPSRDGRPPPMGPAPGREARGFAERHHIDLVYIGTFQLPLYLMIMSAAHAALFYRRDREREASLAKARLHVLTMQLQPHFLFNTLNMIAELVHEDPPKADAMITSLSEMLRLTLDANAAELVPLQQEAQFIERYFAIMQMRFGERLQYLCEIAPEARAALVPPFLLQPLVENAIRHGLDPTPAGGTVTIRAAIAGERLVISVRDTGVGLSEGAPPSEGIGLRNTRERLRQLFGPAASVTLKNGRGLEVEVALPLLTV